MANYNRVILAGNLTRDPQLRYLPNSQTALAEFGMAINRKYKDKEETCFVDCTAWGKQAETLNQYMRKGSPILIEGRLQHDRWEDKDGQKRSKHIVVVERFQFLGGGRSDSAPRPQAQSAPPQDNNYAPPPPMDEPGGEDIPF